MSAEPTEPTEPTEEIGSTDDDGAVASAVARVAQAMADGERLIRAVGSGRRRGTTPRYRRVELRYVDLRSGRHLQVTSYDETQAHARNVDPAEVRSAVDELLSMGFSSWHVETTDRVVQVRVTKKGRPLVHETVRAQVVEPGERRHDRVKLRRLDPADPLFATLDLTTRHGEVKPSRTAKLRQVEDFLAALDVVIGDAVALGPGRSLGPSRPLRIVDLGCGNAYLTFAAARYLSATRGLPITIVGVDQKPQALLHNTDVAAKIGLADRMTFVAGTIDGVACDPPPDVVLALHACDTATDDALARAVRWAAPVVLVAPCCHHDIARQLRRSTAPEGYGGLVRHGILRERFADVLTDSLRASLLRLLGYRVDVVEFVDPAFTPRNTLIRAVRTGAAPTAEQVDEYRTLVGQWALRPALAERLADLVEA